MRPALLLASAISAASASAGVEFTPWFEPVGTKRPAAYRSHGGALTAEFFGRTVRFVNGARTVELRYEGAANSPQFAPEKPAGDIRYGARSVPAYDALRQREVWPGIDVRYWHNKAALEQDFHVAPGADPSRIRLRFSRDPAGVVRFREPVAYQRNGYLRDEVAVRAVRQGLELRFEVGRYDRSRELVIDPPIEVLTGTEAMAMRDAAVDSQGRMIVVGSIVRGNPPNRDVLVRRYEADLRRWSQTTLGSNLEETATAVAVGGDGSFYVAGNTFGTLLFTTGNFQTANAGQGDGFLCLFNPEGGLTQCTLLGRAGADTVTDLGLTRAGLPVVLGVTASTNWPAAGGLQPAHGGANDGFLARFSADLKSLQAFTYLGGSANDEPRALQLDAAGNMYVAGTTSSPNFRVTDNSPARGGADAFLALVQANFSALGFASRFGGSGTETVNALSIHPERPLLYVAGGTTSTDFNGATGVPNAQGAGFITTFTTGAPIVTASGAREAGAADRVNGRFITAVHSFGNVASTFLGMWPVGDILHVYGTTPTDSFILQGRAENPNLDQLTTRLLAAADAVIQMARGLLALFNPRANAPGHIAQYPGNLHTRPPVTPKNLTNPGLSQDFPPAQERYDVGRGGDPVSTATGEFFTGGVDLSLGGPHELRFERRYGTTLATNNHYSALGPFWSHNFDVRLHVTGEAAVIAMMGGYTAAFTKTAAGWQAAPGSQYADQLLETPAGFRFLDFRTSLVYTFNPGGFLTRIEDRNGNAHLVEQGPFGPARVTDGLGRSLTFSYGADFLVAVTDQTGRRLRFGYENGFLASFTDAAGNTTRYETNPDGFLIREVEPAGNAPYRQEYDNNGRVARQTDSRGNVTTFTYEGTRSTRVANAANQTYSHQHQNGIGITGYTDGLGAAYAWTRDLNGRRTGSTDREGKTTATVYHPSGLPMSFTDESGARVTATYTAQAQNGFTYQNLTRLEFPDGSAFQFTYDAAGNPVTATDPAGQTWTYTYNPRGQVLTARNPAGGITAYAYNADATLASVRLPGGDTTTFAYDTEKRVSKIVFADGTSRTYTYGPQDFPLSVTDEKGQTTQFAYDANHRNTAVREPLGHLTAAAFNADNRIESVTDALGAKTSFTYDAAGRLASASDPSGNTVTLAYDAAGRVRSVADAMGLVAGYERDKEGRLVSVTDGLGRKWTLTRDARGLVTGLINPLGESQRASYDSRRRLVSSTDPLGLPSAFAYDARNLVTSVSLPGDVKASYRYNELGRLTGVTDPNGNVWNRTYDSQGRLTSKSTPAGRTTQYTYDARQRLRTAQYADGVTATYSYTATGRIASIRYSDGLEKTAVYDEKDRLIQADGVTAAYDARDDLTRINGLGIEQDAAGRLASITYAPGKVVRYEYNVRDQVTKIRDWVGGETTLDYDSAGQLTLITRPNGVVTTYSYDGAGRLRSIRESRDTLLSSIELTRDAAGRITSADRSYSPAGLAETAQEFTYDSDHRADAATFDERGRVTSLRGAAMTWDAASRLTSIRTADGLVRFEYDGPGMMTARIGSTHDVFVWNYALHLPSPAVQRRRVGDADADYRYFVHLPGGRLMYRIDAETNARAFYHFDETGNTTALTGEDGAVTDTYAVSPFGEVIARSGGTDNPFLWLGAYSVMEEPSAGLYYHRMRFYDPVTARFLSPEPLDLVGARELSPYQYAFANPVNAVDAAGLQGVWELDPEDTKPSFKQYKAIAKVKRLRKLMAERTAVAGPGPLGENLQTVSSPALDDLARELEAAEAEVKDWEEWFNRYQEQVRREHEEWIRRQEQKKVSEEKDVNSTRSVHSEIQTTPPRREPQRPAEPPRWGKMARAILEQWMREGLIGGSLQELFLMAWLAALPY